MTVDTKTGLDCINCLVTWQFSIKRLDQTICMIAFDNCKTIKIKILDYLTFRLRNQLPIRPPWLVEQQRGVKDESEVIEH